MIFERADDGLAVVMATGHRYVLVPDGIPELLQAETFGDWCARLGLNRELRSTNALWQALHEER